MLCSRKMAFALVLAAILLSAIGMAQTQPSNTFKLTVHVTDPSGAEIPDAKVLISAVPPSPASAPIAITTDRRGTATVEIKLGTYKVSIGASGFKSVNEQVQIDRPMSLPVKLEINFYNGPVLVLPVINQALVPTGVQLHELIPEVPGDMPTLHP